MKKHGWNAIWVWDKQKYLQQILKAALIGCHSLRRDDYYDHPQPLLQVIKGLIVAFNHDR